MARAAAQKPAVVALKDRLHNQQPYTRAHVVRVLSGFRVVQPGGLLTFNVATPAEVGRRSTTPIAEIGRGIVSAFLQERRLRLIAELSGRPCTAQE